jgi:DivIVA domain-containing protein
MAMSLTPDDLRRIQFARARRGYDTDAVDGALRVVAESLEGVLRERQELLDRIRELQDALAKSKTGPAATAAPPAPAPADPNEGSLGEALALAERTARDLIADAEQRAVAVKAGAEQDAEFQLGVARTEAESIRTNARSEAERVLADARAAAERLLKEAGTMADRAMEEARAKAEALVAEATVTAADMIPAAAPAPVGLASFVDANDEPIVIGAGGIPPDAALVELLGESRAIRALLQTLLAGLDGRS